MGKKKEKKKKPFTLWYHCISQLSGSEQLLYSWGEKKKVSRKRKEVQSYTQVNQIFTTINEAKQ